MFLQQAIELGTVTVGNPGRVGDTPIRQLEQLDEIIALEALLIVDSAVHVLPSDVYSQVPFALSAVYPVIAIPARLLALDPPDTVSAVSLKLALKRVETVLAVGVATSSASALSVALPEAIGASFTEVTLWLSVTVAALNAVVPPLVATFTVAAVVTAVLESISSAVIVGAGPLKFVAGEKRS